MDIGRCIHGQHFAAVVACLDDNLLGLVGLLQFQIAAAYQRVKVYLLVVESVAQRVHRGKQGYRHAQETVVVVPHIQQIGQFRAGKVVVPQMAVGGAVVCHGVAIALLCIVNEVCILIQLAAPYVGSRFAKVAVGLHPVDNLLQTVNEEVCPLLVIVVRIENVPVNGINGVHDQGVGAAIVGMGEVRQSLNLLFLTGQNGEYQRYGGNGHALAKKPIHQFVCQCCHNHLS